MNYYKKYGIHLQQYFIEFKELDILFFDEPTNILSTKHLITYLPKLSNKDSIFLLLSSIYRILTNITDNENISKETYSAFFYSLLSNRADLTHMVPQILRNPIAPLTEADYSKKHYIYNHTKDGINYNRLKIQYKLNLIKDNYTSCMTVKELAEKINLSEKNVYDLLQNKEMKKIKDELCNTHRSIAKDSQMIDIIKYLEKTIQTTEKYTIKDIAQSTGLKESFIKKHIRVKDISPAYIKQLKKNNIFQKII